MDTDEINPAARDTLQHQPLLNPIHVCENIKKVLVLTLSTSLVKGLVEFQLHHFLCSCGSGGRKSWKVRTLHALGLAPLPSLVALEPLGEVVESGDGQSPAGMGPVSLCRKNLSRC